MKRISEEEIARLTGEAEANYLVRGEGSFNAYEQKHWGYRAVAQAQLESCEEEHKKVVGGIFARLEQYECSGNNLTWVNIPHYDWQALKQKYEVE